MYAMVFTVIRTFGMLDWLTNFRKASMSRIICLWLVGFSVVLRSVRYLMTKQWK